MNNIFILSIFYNLPHVIYSLNMFSISLKKKPNIEENLFADINTLIQDVFDHIFATLNLDKNFNELPQTKMLVSMVSSMKTISERRFRVYIEVVNFSRLDETFNEPENSSLFEVDKLVEEIMEIYSISNNINVNTSTHTYHFNDSIEIPDDSNEAYELLTDYLNNATNIELHDLEKPLSKVQEIFAKHRQFKNARKRNFKVWKPFESPVMESRRMHKTKQTKINKFPFVASIHVKNKFVCTGSIISRDMIISAASCFPDVYYDRKFLHHNPGSIYIRAGSGNPQHGGEWIEATKVIIHPRHSPTKVKNNLAIVKIKKHLHLKKKNRKIRRIKFQKMKGEFPSSVKDVLSIKWDVQEDGRKHRHKNDKKEMLSYTHLKMNKKDDCMNFYSRYVTDQNFCAGVTKNGFGACQHDVGGPAVVSDVLVGIVSFGPPLCDSPHSPTVFTYIGHYVDWIENILNGDHDNEDAMTSSPPDYLIQSQELDGLSLSPINNQLTNRDTTQFAIEKIPKELFPKRGLEFSRQKFLREGFPQLDFPGQKLPEPLNGLPNMLKNIKSPPLDHLQNVTSQHFPLDRDHRISFGLNPFQSIRQNENKAKTPSENHKVTIKSYDDLESYENVNKFLRMGAQSESEDYTSDSDDYESTDEQGISVESASSDLSKPPLREGHMSLYAPAPKQLDTKTEFPFSGFEFSGPSGNPYDVNPVDLIKNFVNNKLAPISSKLELPKINFKEEAHNFLIKNFLKERLFPMARHNFSTSVPLNSVSSHEKGEKFLGKKYSKHHNTKESIETDKYGSLFLKESTRKTEIKNFASFIRSTKPTKANPTYSESKSAEKTEQTEYEMPSPLMKYKKPRKYPIASKHHNIFLNSKKTQKPKDIRGELADLLKKYIGSDKSEDIPLKKKEFKTSPSLKITHDHIRAKTNSDEYHTHTFEKHSTLMGYIYNWNDYFKRARIKSTQKNYKKGQQ